MKVVIVEDEPLAVKALSRLLTEIIPDIEIIETLDSVNATISWANANVAPDLYFMDIQLSDGVSFDIFDSVKIQSPIIFTTAYDEYAIRAFKVNSIDYLLKPIDKVQLQLALSKYQRLFSSGIPSADVNQFVSAYKSETLPKYKERFLAHFKSGMVPVVSSRVSYFVKDVIIYLVTVDNERLVTDYATLDEIEDVADPTKFFRANRQSIIQIEEVETYKKLDTGKIEVYLKSTPSISVDVSREKANDFIRWIDK